jgi:FlaA1/EpsC-like NDP-sugar epimerase
LRTDQRPGLVPRLILDSAAARVLILFVFHAVVFAACYGFAYLLRFDFDVPAEFVEKFRSSFAIVVGIELLLGVLFGFYRGWWRYVGIADVVRLVTGLSAAHLILVGAWYISDLVGLDPRLVKYPRGVLLINWAFSLLTLFGARVFIRMTRDRFRSVEDTGADHKRVVIVGAGDAGETLAREIEHRPQLRMKVVGFIDDQRAKWGSQIRGINVSGPIARVAEISDDLDADEALIAIPSASGARIREVIHHLSKADLKFKTIPGIDHLVSGRVHVSQLRAVNLEDLLRRKQIELPGDPVRNLFKGRRVLVTGAGGTIGSELSSQILQFEPERLALVERSEYALYEVGKRLHRESGWATSTISSNLVDINNRETLDELMERERPEIVLHAAAHKHVPLGEQNPLEYLRNNCLATRAVADLSVAHGVKRFVFISTDKAINPSSVMGASKRAAEIALLDVAATSNMTITVVRFGNVLGSSGSVVPLFMEQIEAGGPVTVTHPDVTRYFIRTSEAISLVLQAATLGNRGQIFMLDMGEPVKIVDLARDMIRLSNHTEDEIPVVFTGLRAGEKLFEEIHLEGESIHATIHPQIVITESPQPDPGCVVRWLERARDERRHEGAVALMSALIPEFEPARPVEKLRADLRGVDSLSDVPFAVFEAREVRT